MGITDTSLVRMDWDLNVGSRFMIWLDLNSNRFSSKTDFEEVIYPQFACFYGKKDKDMFLRLKSSMLYKLKNDPLAGLLVELFDHLNDREEQNFPELTGAILAKCKRVETQDIWDRFDELETLGLKLFVRSMAF